MTGPGGNVVAIVGRGTPLDRAVAVACAEGGAGIAFATVSEEHDDEFAVNSIANEVWSIGRDHFVRQMTAWEPTAAASFADECFDRLGRCDALVINTTSPSEAPLEELSGDEWDNTVRRTLTAPFLLGHAFGRLMVREGKGIVVVVALDREDGDLSERAALAGLRTVVQGMNDAWNDDGVRFELVPVPNLDEPVGGASAVIALLSNYLDGK